MISPSLAKVAPGTFWDLTNPMLAANYLPYASKVVLGTFGQHNAQASKIAQVYIYIPLNFPVWNLGRDLGQSTKSK